LTVYPNVLTPSHYKGETKLVKASDSLSSQSDVKFYTYAKAMCDTITN